MGSVGNMSATLHWVFATEGDKESPTDCPMVFGFDLLGRSFGRFGWANLWGICQVFHPEGTQSRGDDVYNYGVTIPFIVIFISYAALGLCHRRRQGESNRLV